MTTEAYEHAENLIERNFFLGEETLNLSGLGLTKLPPLIGILKHLKVLRLGQSDYGVGRGNFLRSLPNEIFDLVNLEILDLSNNRFSQLNRKFHNLVKLKELYLEGNKLKGFPTVITELNQLQILRLSQNQISEIPITIGRLRKLQELELLVNTIREIPVTIGNLQNLVVLDLHQNAIEVLPKEIGQCFNIQKIFISKNRVTGFPREIENLVNLRTLDVRQNKIYDLPPEFQKLNKLKKLDLRENELAIPPEVLDKIFSPQSITNFYFQNVKPLNPNEIRPLNEVKMLILGEGSVGKSSLVKYLLSSRKRNHQEKTTEGIQRNIWYFSIKHSLTGENHDLRVKVWDFGGQEIQHQTHQFFLTKRSFYLIVIDARRGKEESRLEHWLKTVESYAGDAPIIVVINKIDENPAFEIDKKGLKRKYSSIKDFVLTSCETGKGIEELKQKIQYHLCGEELKEIFLPFNRKWRSVKDEIEKINQDSVNFDEYQNICIKKGVKDSLSQIALIDFLHDLGTILYYRQDRHLKVMGVLNPAWVTQGVYCFVTDSRIKKSGGIMTLTDLDRLLTEPFYPAHKRPYILEMMKKYELVFSYGENGYYLVADLLPEEEPKEAEEWEEKSLLRFRYNYSFLSSKIISRFIVRTKQIIKEKLYWRRGVVLSNANNFALIRADLEERQIIIYVGGVQTTCRDFLSQLRHVFDGIHGEINNLEVDEFVTPMGYPNAIIKYDDLITAESVGEKLFFVPELKRRVTISDLLDGIENPANRLPPEEQNKTYRDLDIMTKVFLSHSSKDKEFARQIVTKLNQENIHVWFDENEIHVGDSIIQKISLGLQESKYILYVLSPDSVESNWVKEEFNAMIVEQIIQNNVKVLPLLYRDCEIPMFLRDKLYIDFRDPFKYETEFQKLVDRIKH